MSKTVTSIFMLPTLKIPKHLIKQNGFIDAFVKDINKEFNYEDSIYLLFHPNDIDKFREFLDAEYERTTYIIEDYDYDNGYVVVVYKLNPILKNDFEKVKMGEYSKTSKLFKNEFVKTVKIISPESIKTEKSLQHRIFEKTEDMRLYWEERLDFSFTEDMEVWRDFDEENETLDIEKIIKQSI